jgi:predicted RNA-binding Zn-ribbon protein involved in translation (DUF1610 family)
VENKKRTIANEITGADDDSYCSVCGDDTLVVKISGQVNCNYCGNDIILCQHCLAKMLSEIGNLNIVG